MTRREPSRMPGGCRPWRPLDGPMAAAVPPHTAADHWCVVPVGPSLPPGGVPLPGRLLARLPCLPPSSPPTTPSRRPPCGARRPPPRRRGDGVATPGGTPPTRRCAPPPVGGCGRPPPRGGAPTTATAAASSRRGGRGPFCSRHPLPAPLAGRPGRGRPPGGPRVAGRPAGGGWGWRGHRHRRRRYCCCCRQRRHPVGKGVGH